MRDITQEAVLSAQGLQRRDIKGITTGLSPEELLANQPADELLAEIPEPATGDECAIQLATPFPPTFAVVYVEAKDGHYFVRAHNARQRTLYTELASPPDLAFDVQMKKHKPSEIRGVMRQFSQKNSEAKKIRGWLTKLRGTLQKQFSQSLKYVVIHDRTDFEIPWEMLNLSEREHLGSSMVTVRWQDIQVLEDGWDEEQFTTLDIQKENCLGAIVAYANTKDFQGVKDEINLLQRYNAQCIENIHEFLKVLSQLHQLKSPIGLVFIASHGFLETEVFEAALGETDRKQRISLSELYGYDFEFLKIYRSIVFMNACHSGRLRWERQVTGQKTGLATFFLERGARGVIGTMGQIEDRYAPKIAQCFLAEYENAPDQSVAEVLRRIREQALQNLQKDPSEENWAMFLFTFMYVYYGNPMTVLHLSPSGGQPHV